MKSPTPLQIAMARQQSGLSMEDAAALIYASPHGWVKWERGQRSMRAGDWELWRIKAGYLPCPCPACALLASESHKR